MATITSDDVCAYYQALGLVNFGRRNQFQGIRFDSGPNAGTTVFFDGTVELPLPPVLDCEKLDQKLSMVIKLDSPSKDIPLKKIGDMHRMHIPNVDYYKEAMKDMAAKLGY